MEFRYFMHIDLIYHVLAYMKVNNDSDCYNRQYIDNMLIEKGSFDYNIEVVIINIEKYYNANFNRLMYINFLPFICADYEEMKDLFLNFPNFTDKDKEFFIKPFVEALDKEMEFYFPYWKDKHNTNQEDRLCIEQ